MNEFTLWYTYYDSLFLNVNPKLSQLFYEEYPSIKLDIIFRNQNGLTIFVLVFLWFFNSFKILSNNLLIGSIHNASINQLMYFIAMEKSYAFAFWKADHRRIQASMAHFYTFLQFFAKSIIPYPTMTIFECKSSNKLCVSLFHLQKLMNQILKCMKPISKFLSQQLFSQQQKLIQNFLQNWYIFMKKLPNIKRNKFNHIHNLVKFICLTNPIQICTSYRIDQKDNIRRKSNTVGTQLQLKGSPKVIYHYRKKIYQSQKLKRSYSSSEFYNRTNEDQVLSLPDYQKKNKIFKFPPSIFQNALSQQQRVKALSLGSLIPLKNKVQSLIKQNIRQTQLSCTSRLNTSATTISSQTKKNPKFHNHHTSKSHQHYSTKNKSSSNKSISLLQKNIFKKQINQFYDYQQQKNSDQISRDTSKQSNKKIGSLIFTLINYYKLKFKQLEKIQFIYANSHQFDINYGGTKKIGWDVVRAYVYDKIQIKKLNSILQK